MRSALLPLATLVAAVLLACAPRAVIPDAERDRVRRELTGDQRWLRVAAYAAPLWGDTSKVLLSDQPLAELDRVLAKDDPTSALTGLPEEQRAAVLKKELLEGMSPRAVEMAWGLPEKKRIDRPSSTEDWSWPGGKRRAFFQEDRLVRWEK